jgi:hypothetical protein
MVARTRSRESAGPAPDAPAYRGSHDGERCRHVPSNRETKSRFPHEMRYDNLPKRGLRHLGVTQDLHPVTLFFSRCGVILVRAFLAGTPRVPAFTQDISSDFSGRGGWSVIGLDPPMQSGHSVGELREQRPYPLCVSCKFRLRHWNGFSW